MVTKPTWWAVLSRAQPWPGHPLPFTWEAGLTCGRSYVWAALVVYHLYPVQKLWAGAPDLQVVLHRLGGGAPPRALALVLFAKGFQVRAVSGLWLSSCANQVPAGLQDHAGPRPCGHDDQRSLPQDGGARGAPGSCSCTPAPSRSYWRCHGSRHTKSGYTGPLTPQSTSGQPSLHMTQEHWAADTSPGRLWIVDGTCHPGGQWWHCPLPSALRSMPALVYRAQIHPCQDP